MASERLVEWVDDLEGDHLVETVRQVYKARGNAVAVRRRDGEPYLLYQDAGKDPDAEGFDGVVWIPGVPPTPPDVKAFRELQDALGARRAVLVDDSGNVTDPDGIEVLDAEALAEAIETHAIAAGADRDEEPEDPTTVAVEEWEPPPPAAEGSTTGTDPFPDEPTESDHRSAESGADPGDEWGESSPADDWGEDDDPEAWSEDPIPADGQGGDPPRSERGRRQPPPADSARRRQRRDVPPPPADEGTESESIGETFERLSPELGPRSSSARVVAGIAALAVVLVVVAVLLSAGGGAGGSTGFLDTKSEATGEESKAQVVDRVTVVGTSATIEEGTGAGELTLVLERAPGSGAVDLSSAILQVIGPDGDKRVTLAAPTVSVAVEGDDDGSLSAGSYRLNSDQDRVRLTIAVGPNGVVDLDPGETATVRVTTGPGNTTEVDVQAPPR